jgi:hypothetical protein
VVALIAGQTPYHDERDDVHRSSSAGIGTSAAAEPLD